MKIKLFICAMAAVAGLTATKAKAQDSPYAGLTHFSIGVSGLKPIGGFGDTHNMGIGGQLQVEAPVGANVFVLANVGYNRFMAKDNMKYVNPNTKVTIANVTDISMIPVKIGAKYAPVQYFYLQGDLGITSLLNSNKLHTDRSALVTFAPQIGTQLSAGSNSMIDIGVRYETMKNFYNAGDRNNFIGLTLAYSFGLK